MPTLPDAADFTGSTVTEAGFKTAITNLRDFLAELLGTAGTDIAALQAMGVPLNQRVAKTAAYTVVTADRGVLIDATSGTWTLSLTALATLGSGFVFAVRNSGTGTITIDPDGSEQIDGATTVGLSSGESCFVLAGTSSWFTMGKGGGAPDRQTFTSSGTWSKPSRGTLAVIECWGGGGSGAKGEALGIDGGGGGGGSYVRRIMRLADLGSSETVTIGAGGAAKTAVGAGNTGGNTTFGAHVTAHGGQGGGQSGNLAKASGGGGGGGEGFLGGLGGYGAGDGGDGSGAGSSVGKDSHFGGGGGGSGGGGGAGGRSMYGGGGGGGVSAAGGTSIYGGNGSAGTTSTASAAGTQPGGGSGGTSGGNSGAGGAGKCVVTVI